MSLVNARTQRSANRFLDFCQLIPLILVLACLPDTGSSEELTQAEVQHADQGAVASRGDLMRESNASRNSSQAVSSTSESVSHENVICNARVISIGSPTPAELKEAAIRKIPALEFVALGRIDTSSLVAGDILFMSTQRASFLTQEELSDLRALAELGVRFIVEGEGLRFREALNLHPEMQAYPGSNYRFHGFFLSESGFLCDMFASDSISARYRVHNSSEGDPVDTVRMPTEHSPQERAESRTRCFVAAVEWACTKEPELAELVDGQKNGAWNSAYSTRWQWTATDRSFVFDIDVFKLIDTRHHSDWYRVDVTPYSEVTNFHIDTWSCGWYVPERDITSDFRHYDIPGYRESDLAEYGPTSTVGGSTTGFTIGASLNGVTPGLDASYSQQWSSPCVSTTDNSSVPNAYTHWWEDFDGPSYLLCPFNTLDCIPAKATFYSNPSAIGKVESNGTDCPNGTKVRFDPLCAFYYDHLLWPPVPCILLWRDVLVLGGYDGWVHVNVNLDPTIDSYYPTNTTPPITIPGYLDFGVEATDPDGSNLACQWSVDDQPRSTNFDWRYEPSPGEAGTRTVKATVTDCKGASDEQVWTVTVECDKPGTPTISGPSDVCGNQGETYSASASGSPTSWSWSSSCGGQFNPQNGNPTTWTPPTGYTGSCQLSVTATNICGTSDNAGSKSVNVKQKPGTPTISPNPPSPICSGSFSQLTASATGNPTGWSWNASCGTIGGSGSNVTYYAPTVGSITVCNITATATNTCGPSSPGAYSMTIDPCVEEMIVVTSPNGGESWCAGSTHNITWTCSEVSNVRIEYTTNGGSNWTPIESSIACALGSYPWSVPYTPSGICLVRISDSADGQPADASDSYFAIEVCEEIDSVCIAYGWNIASLPSLPPYAPIPRDSIFGWMPLYGYDCNTYSYYIPQYLDEGEGYWVAKVVPPDTCVTYPGTPISCYTETLCLGWSMIGSTGEPVPFSTVVQNPQSCVIPHTLYWWDSSSRNYLLQDTIKPERGYWVAAMSPCTIRVCNPPGKLPFAKLEGAEELEQPLWMASIFISSDGVCEAPVVREFGISMEATEDFDPCLDLILPPPSMDQMAIDAYFQGGGLFNRFARDIRGANESHVWSLKVKSEAGITLAWSISQVPQHLDLRLDYADETVSLEKESSLSIPEGGVRIFDVIVDRKRDEGSETAADQVLSGFELFQCHPNPFNLETSIRFELPKDHHVRLAIFNVSGQLVKTLVEEWRTAGTHEVVWDGRDNSGKEVASGIYLYKLQAGEFQKARSTVLLK